MTGDVAVQSRPVGIILSFLRQSGLGPERSQQTVYVILQKDFDIEVTGVLERAVKQLHVPDRELVVIKTVLCGHLEAQRHQRCGNDQQFFHYR